MPSTCCLDSRPRACPLGEKLNCTLWSLPLLVWLLLLRSSLSVNRQLCRNNKRKRDCKVSSPWPSLVRTLRVLAPQPTDRALWPSIFVSTTKRLGLTSQQIKIRLRNIHCNRILKVLTNVPVPEDSDEAAWKALAACLLTDFGRIDAPNVQGGGFNDGSSSTTRR